MKPESVEDYKEVVANFVEMYDTLFFVFSEDSSFIKTCNKVFVDDLNFDMNRIRMFDEYEKVILETKREIQGHRVLLFIEHSLENEANVCFTRFLKLTFPSIYILFLTSEIESEKIIYLYENGIDNCITKPVSAETLVEKTAFTMEPPNKIRHLIDFGKKALLDGVFEESLGFSNKVLSIKPNSPAGLMLRGDSLKGLGRRKEALAAYMQAWKSGKLYLEPLKKLADFYKEEGDHELQLRYLQELTRLSPLNLERKVLIGSLHARLGRLSHAEAEFAEAISMARERARTAVEGVRQKVIETCLEHAPGLAEHYLREDLSRQKSQHTRTITQMTLGLGLSLRRQGRWQEAVVEYQKALALEPESILLLTAMALSYLEGEDYKSAAATVDELLEVDPDLMGLEEEQCLDAGRIYALAGDLKMARLVLTRCLGAPPDETMLENLLQHPPGRT